MSKLNELNKKFLEFMKDEEFSEAMGGIHPKRFLPIEELFPSKELVEFYSQHYDLESPVSEEIAYALAIADNIELYTDNRGVRFTKSNGRKIANHLLSNLYDGACAKGYALVYLEFLEVDVIDILEKREVNEGVVFLHEWVQNQRMVLEYGSMPEVGDEFEYLDDEKQEGSKEDWTPVACPKKVRKKVQGDKPEDGGLNNSELVQIALILKEAFYTSDKDAYRAIELLTGRELVKKGRQLKGQIRGLAKIKELVKEVEIQLSKRNA